MTDFPLPPSPDLNRPELHQQRALLARLLPPLASHPAVQAVWLTGSLARQDADRWSSVDLCLAWADTAVPPAAVQALLSQALADDYCLIAQERDGQGGGSLHALTLAPAGAPAGGDGGLGVSVHWARVARLESLRAWHGPVHLLFTADALPPEQAGYLQGDFPPLEPPQPEAVAGLLARFWLELANLPGAVNRQEALAAQALLTRLRAVLIDLVVALNGARRPPSPRRINSYLGPAQRDAFEKSLGRGGARPEDWIGQAVALIVLYRWYAPQLVEMYRVAYPQRLEETVLPRLAGEIDGWPRTISTE